MKVSFLSLCVFVCINFASFYPNFGQTGSEYQLFLRNGSLNVKKNISETTIRTLNTKFSSSRRKSLVIIQFEEIPTDAEREQLKQDGIELLDYIPNKAYIATVQGSLTDLTLKRSRARAIMAIDPQQKINPGLKNKENLSKAARLTGVLDVWISFPKSISYEEVRADLDAARFQVTSDVFKNYQILALQIDKDRLDELAALSVVKYIEAAPGEDQPINDKSETNSRANVLRSNALAGYNLLGKGVVVGVGDESNPLRHIDFSGRMINRAPNTAGSHGLHVMGVLGGAGIVNEQYKGYAPKATIVSQYYSKIYVNAATYVKDYGMVITNNSYGVTASVCGDFGEYTLSSYVLDQQAFEMPYLQHVFAAGNSGNTAVSCAVGFGNVLSGYQSAKNVLTVGNTNVNGLIASGSSKGPVKDGRTKPEIAAQGTSVTSTVPIDGYAASSGTSFASPAVAGGLALLYERYRNLHGQANPKNGLMKALVCNGAEDQGLIGPDYSYGFGWMNLARSIKMLDNNSYLSSSVSNGVTNEHAINVPANTARLKVMLYWNDPGSSVYSGKILVNDLDVTVKRQGSTAVLPLLHNKETQETGVDDKNNMEQVVIDNPTAGSYSISVKGKTISQGSQEYFIVYDAIGVSTTLTYPIGKERFVKGDSIYVSWDSYGTGDQTFKIEYSVNNGGEWRSINTGVASNLRQVKWGIPDEITDMAKVRVTCGNVVKESEPFTILALPIVTLPATQCEGYISMNWTAVPGATDYEVLMLAGEEMKTIAVSTSLSHTIGGLSKDSTYYVSVRPRLNGNPGRQAVAKKRIPDSGNCAGDVWDKDLRIERIVTPSGSGRRLTSTELVANTQIKIRIKNLDDVVSNGEIKVGYAIGNNGSTVYSELISPSIPPNGSVDHTFSTGVDLSAVGAYRLKVFVKKPGDNAPDNDSLVAIYKQLDNAPVVMPFLDQIETLAKQEVSTGQVGLEGGDRYDFSSSTSIGRLRSFVNTGIAFSGIRAFTLDANRYDAAGNTSYLLATYNFAALNPVNDDIRLTFRYKNHGQVNHENNKVWIRGSDQHEWIQVYDLFANQNQASATYKLTANIEVSNFLKTAGQPFTSSFQVRWGQWGDMITADMSSSAGYTIDDISFSGAPNDVQVVSIDSPVTVSCGLGGSELIKVTVRNNTSGSLSNIPIRMQIDNGTVVSRTISSIAAATSVQYTFNQTANLSSLGSHVVKVWVDFSGDGSPANNTKELTLYNSQTISSFPYLQNFETSNGFWRSEGVNSSWEYGTPASSKINGAPSGSKAWKTSLTGNYNDQENSYLYSPCFSIAGLTNPTLSFSVAMDIDDCEGGACDVVFVEYSTSGNSWSRLGAKGQGTNWYDATNNAMDAWSVKDYTRWHVSTIPIPSGASNIRFRFVMQSNSGSTREGIAIDDIHIYDLGKRIYAGDVSSPVVIQPSVSGTGWVNFMDNGRIIASIMPNNNNLGNTSVQANINTSAVRNHKGQYYLDRNFTIKPTSNSFLQESTVRLYFQDAEFEKMIRSTECSGCSAPASAYDLSLSKFSTSDVSKEDGSLHNDIDDNGWSFFAAGDVVKVPYDDGYYVEFKTRSFSEFWLAGDAISTQSGPLPVELVNFSAKKGSSTEDSRRVFLEWGTSSEKNFGYFEIELALGDEAVRLNRFQKIGEVNGKGNSTSDLKYVFTDIAADGYETRYYRLKMIDRDGGAEYSTIRAVVYSETAMWRVYPNPSKAVFNLELQSAKVHKSFVNVYDKSGRLFKKAIIPPHDQVQNIKIDLSSNEFGKGLYMLEVLSGLEKRVFKVILE
jgi:hypothetical protein